MVKHINSENKKEYVYLLKLLYASLFDKDIPLPPDYLDWKFLYRLVNYNTCQTLFFNGINKLPKKYLPPEEIYSDLKQKNSICIVHDTNQMLELNSLFEDFEKNQIYFIPLKGYVIKADYPRSYFRLMSDSDILFMEEQIDIVKQVFAKHDFKFTFFDDDNQYHFEKPPYVYIEMHTSLVNHKDEMYDYYCEIWSKAHSKQGYKYFYEMTLEDYYIYMLVHSSKHFRLSGIGLRHLLDMYLFNQKYKNRLDYKYLQEELEKLGLYTYEKQLMNICVKWFEKQDFQEFSLIEEYILLSSTLGTRAVTFANMSLDHKKEMEKGKKKPSKIRFFLKSVFPSIKSMQIHYRYLEKLPFLLPVSWIQMWFSRLFIQRNVSFKEGMRNRLNYISDEDEQYINNILKSAGFKEK